MLYHTQKWRLRRNVLLPECEQYHLPHTAAHRMAGEQPGPTEGGETSSFKPGFLTSSGLGSQVTRGKVWDNLVVTH